MLRLERPENIKRISVYDEELLDCFTWTGRKEIKIFKMVGYPWDRFKEPHKEYIKTITIKEGFYGYGFKDEYGIRYFGYTEPEDYFKSKDISSIEFFVRDNKLYCKPYVEFIIDGDRGLNQFFTTYQEAVDYAKVFIKHGLNVILGE